MNHICNCLNGFHLDGGWYPVEVKVNESHFLSWTEPGWPAMLNHISQWPWNERRRWMEMEERKSQPEREKNLLLLSTIASLCDFFSLSVSVARILLLPCLPFLFPFSPSPSVNLWRPDIITVKKSHCGANTKATHTMSHMQARTRLLATHSCVEREWLFFYDWVLTPSSELVPLESWARQINSVNRSLWFSCQTLLAHSLSPCISDCVIVTSLFWREDELIAVTVCSVTQLQSQSVHPKTFASLHALSDLWLAS